MPDVPVDFKMMVGSLPGLDSDSFLRAMEETPSIGVRFNPVKLSSSADMGYEPDGAVPWCSSGIYLPSRPQFTLNPLLHAGAFYVQDPSSMVYESLAAKALDSLPDSRKVAPRILDMCASPGGKTTAMLAALPAGSVMVANEYTPQRTAALRENLAKWGHPSVLVCSSDTAGFAEAGELFDIVAVDAPCSGEGMMRKDEDARAQWSEGLVKSCASLQREILSNAVNSLSPGGILVYSTCTFNTCENEENIEWLVRELGLSPVDTELAGVGGILKQLTGEVPAVRFMPHATRGEGLFAAMFRKPGFPENAVVASPAKGKNKKNARKGRGYTEKGKCKESDASIIERLLIGGEDWTFSEDNDRLEALTSHLEDIREILEGRVKILDRGVTVAYRKGHDWVPASELTLSSAYKRGTLPEVELPEAEALTYLRGEAMVLPDAPKGIVVITHQGLPLGVAKNLGNRANNLYPSRWKIRHL